MEGNSLVGSEVYDFKKDLLAATATRKETINAFDYEKHFSAVFDTKRPGGSGFDCIIGNPPYVKLQNFKKVYPETADFLRNATGKGGAPRYASCQTGSFDLYLPFIERGLELLNVHGRLGYIAPSLWRYNEYGEGLRKLLHNGGHLDRWIDFGSFQVFDEAIIYTALQFYSKSRNDRVRFALAPSGEITRIHDWDDPNWYTTYKELSKDDAWILVPRHEREIINKLNKTCKRLDDPAVAHIFVGVQTSADPIYHLQKVGKNKYKYQPPTPDGEKKKPPMEEVEIEDRIMHPLISGAEANRYETPETSTYLLFPYEVEDDTSRLMTRARLRDGFPKAWDYFLKHEVTLRARESGKMDNDDGWWGYNYPKNLDRQQNKKLAVAQTVNRMAVCPDDAGKFYLNNVRVNGILPKNDKDFWYLLGILNSTVADWVFRRIAKPKEGGYFEANKQFIAPLPIPKATKGQAADMVAHSKKLTELHTQLRDVMRALERRFDACEIEEKSIEWLWPTVETLDHWKSKAPSSLARRDQTAWAKEKRLVQINEAVSALKDKLRPGAVLEVELKGGELRLHDDGTIVLDGVFVSKAEAQAVLLDWRQYLRGITIAEGIDVARFADALRCIRKPKTAAVAEQIAEFDQECRTILNKITKVEQQANNLAYAIYGLSAGEIAMIENG